LDDLELAVEELRAFRDAGGSTIVDATSIGLGRDVKAVAEVSRQSGVLIVAGCGYYRALGHPPELAGMTVEAIADVMIGEITEGIAGSSIRPGIIGEIGTSFDITETEWKVVRAAAIAQRATGLAVNLHHDPWARRGLDVLDEFADAGGDVTRAVLSHVDHCPMSLEYLLAVAERGAFVEFDGFGCEWYVDSIRSFLPRDTERIVAIGQLRDRGHLERVLVGSDTCRKVQLMRYGGWGYSHIPAHIRPMFGWFGLSSEDADRVLIHNPRRLLTIDG
jgi:phosphotriesterase-related protein